MNRKLTFRKLRRQRGIWQTAAITLGAILLMGAGTAALTGSRLFINADSTPGDKLRVSVDGTEVFKISHDGADSSVDIDGDLNVTGDVSGGSSLPSGLLVYSDDPDDTALLADGYTREPARDVIGQPRDLASNAPAARSQHTAVWTGAEMIVWGGSDNDGGRYDPVTNIWTPTSTVNASNGRTGHTAIWTGTEMIVWGGYYSGHLDTGVRYNPDLDTWTQMETNGAPAGRRDHAAVWTGTEMIVWGGRVNSTRLDDGGIYNPSTNSWTPIPADAAISARSNHTAVWTGTDMIVWGGYDGTSYLNTGASYASGTWTALTTTGAPPARQEHTAVWTGTEMLVWGGYDGGVGGGFVGSGGRYDPAGSGTWNAITSTNAPTARRYHTTVWTGTEMMVWGGSDWDSVATAAVETNTGGRYSPGSDTWIPTTPLFAPSARKQHAAVWTGASVLVWGGSDGGSLSDGGMYLPGLDAWASPTAFAYRAP